jgi:exodeoxyribonuclease VII large subunit
MEENSRYLTIQALTKYIKRKFDRDPHLTDIYLKGEISNFKRHSSGHMYFTLKDERARILAVMFSSANQNMKFTPENGMKVMVRGDISVYEPGGQYQVYVKEMSPDGIGELFLAFEQLKEKLEKEGLFNIDRKRALPKYPKKIAIVTSATGAAIRDIVTTIKRRYSIAELILFPALVQGKSAASSIVKSIGKANAYEGIDVLIVGRGGGSIEELWAFNEEPVARAIYQSKVPVISAVGHETDFTIADFVSDLRAPTPTAAGELAVPHIDELIERILNKKIRLVRALKGQLQEHKAALHRLKNSYVLRNPQTIYQQKVEQIDQLIDRFYRNEKYRLQGFNTSLNHMDSRLARSHPSKTVDLKKTQFCALHKELDKQMRRLLTQKKQRFSGALTTLEALSPLKIMDRGYSLVYDHEKKLVKHTRNVSKDEKVVVHLQDGKLYCNIEHIEEGEGN